MKRQMFVYRTSPEVSTLIAGRPMMDPISLHSHTTRSRLVVDGEEATSLLVMIAVAKFGMWDPNTQKPYWVDRDHQNESFDNVELAELFGSEPKPKLGAIAGTKEYWKAYREKNREKVRQHQRNHYQKRKELLKVAKQLTLVNNPNAAIVQEEETDESIKSLLEIVKSTLGDKPLDPS